jgi:uncharacterized Zn finger protein (UPF0148 family)
MTPACSRCGTPFSVLLRGYCSNCHQKESSAERAARIAEENARVEAKRRHPSYSRTRARHLWIDSSAREHSGEAEHIEECAS